MGGGFNRGCGKEQVIIAGLKGGSRKFRQGVWLVSTTGRLYGAAVRSIVKSRSPVSPVFPEICGYRFAVTGELGV